MIEQSPEVLRDLLDYNPETGALTWRHRPIELFRNGRQSAEHNCKAWNARYAGRPAFTANSGEYKQGTLFGKALFAHRVIWALMTGAWPNGVIDHKNGDGCDNRWTNLRAVSQSTNLRNRRKGSNNTSGVIGVHWHEREKKWHAQIKLHGKTTHLGLFRSIDAAAAARKTAENALGFTERHGGNP